MKIIFSITLAAVSLFSTKAGLVGNTGSDEVQKVDEAINTLMEEVDLLSQKIEVSSKASASDPICDCPGLDYVSSKGNCGAGEVFCHNAWPFTKTYCHKCSCMDFSQWGISPQTYAYCNHNGREAGLRCCPTGIPAREYSLEGAHTTCNHFPNQEQCPNPNRLIEWILSFL